MTVIVIGSVNKDKINALKENTEYTVIGVNVESGVSEQPYGIEETHNGAKNRAMNAYKEHSLNGDIFIGIESGILKQTDEFYDFTCIYVFYKRTNKHEIYETEFTKIPNEHHDILYQCLENKEAYGKKIEKIEKLPDGSWQIIYGKYSRKQLITRALSNFFKSLKVVELDYGFKIYHSFKDVPFVCYEDISTDLKLRDKHVNNLLKQINQLESKPTCILALESGGYYIASILSYILGVKYVKARKGGKLPGDVAKVNYSMEYRKENVLEIKTGYLKKDDKVMIVDDIIVTGGTVKGAIELVNHFEANIHSICCYGTLYNDFTYINGYKLVKNVHIERQTIKWNNPDAIILLSGKCYSGKDTVAKMTSFKRISIADTMKREYNSFHGLSIDWENRNQKEFYRKSLIEFTHRYPFEHWLKLTPYCENCIVTDVRTIQEIKYIKSLFSNVITVRLNASDEQRKKRGWIKSLFDESYLETELDNFKFDHVYKNDTGEDLNYIVHNLTQRKKYKNA